MSAAVLLVVLGLAAAAALGRPALTLSVLVGSVFVLPAAMVLPHSPTGVLTGLRVVEAAAVWGALRAGRPPRERGVPYVLLLLVAYAGVVCVTGVALADPRVDPVTASYAWLGVLDQVVVVLLALHLARFLSSAHVAVLLAGAALLAALVGLGEWVTGESWARAVLRAADPNAGGVAAQVLEQRSGSVRIRGATEFALAYGWLLAALIPVVAVSVRAARGWFGLPVRLVLACGVGLLFLGVVLSRSRSPLAAALGMVVVLVALLAPRRPAYLVLLAVLIAGGTYWLGPDVLHRLAPGVDQGSVDVRVQRLPQVLELAAADPYRGTGLTGLRLFGPGFVDSSFLQIYAEAGAIAVVLLVLALVGTTVAVARGVLRGLAESDALLALGCALGMLTLGVGAAFFDAFTTLSTSLTFWILAGAGLVAADRSVGALPRPGSRALLSANRLLLVACAVAVGFGIRAFAPSHATGTAVYSTVSMKTQVTTDPSGLERTLVTTACQAARDAVAPGESWRLSSCEEQKEQGWFRVQVTAPNRELVDEGLSSLRDGFRAFPHLFGLREQRGIAIVVGIPTAARVAPMALGVVAGAFVLLVPGRRLDRSVRRARPDNHM